MNQLLQVIKNKGIPIDSANSAVMYLGVSEYGIGQQTDAFYLDGIESLTGERITERNRDKLRSIFAYVVCTVIEQQGEIDDEKMLLTESITKTEKASKKPGFNKQVLIDPVLDTNGNVKPKKGSKKVLAEELYISQIKGKDMKRKDAISLFVKEGVSTLLGSSTYYANCKKKYGK